MPALLDIVIPGRVVPWSRAGRNAKTGATYTPAAMASYKRTIQAYARIKQRRAPPFEGPVAALILATYEPPKRMTKAEKIDAKRNVVFFTGKPDVDNIGKVALDALNDLIYRDDSQIVASILAKRYGRANELAITLVDATETPMLDALWARFRALWTADHG